MPGIDPAQWNKNTHAPQPTKSAAASGGTGGSKTGGRRQTYKSPLANIEFDSASDVIRYANTLRQLGRAEQLELHTAADELEAVLRSSVGNVFERAAARRKARKISNLLRKAGDHSRGMSVEAVKLSRAFKREYASMLNPPRKTNKHVLNWKD
jgi:hypothetical protein